MLAGGRLWVGSSEGILAYASTDDGKLTKFGKLEGAISLAPVVANQTLYVLDNSGRITAYR